MSIDIGDRIRDFRRQAGLNQDELAELASLNRVTIAKYESGKVEPGAKALSRIADALEISTDELLGRKDYGIVPDMDSWELREAYRLNPKARILFDAIPKVKPEHLNAVVATLKALEPEAFSE